MEDVLGVYRWPDCGFKELGKHLYYLEQVISLLDEAGVKRKLKKSFFFQGEIEYDDHIIDPGRLTVARDSKTTE